MGPDTYIASMACTASNFAPVGTMLCKGQIVSINDFPALFSLISNIYGGDGRATFGLPDMRGRTAVGVGQGTGLTTVFLGQPRGAELATVPIPLHNHKASTEATSQTFPVYGDIQNPGGKVLSNANLNISSTSFSGTASVSGTVPVTGTTPVTLNGYLTVNNNDGASPVPQINGSFAKATAGGTPVNMFDTARAPNDVPGAFVSVSGDIPATGKTVDGSGFSVDTSGLSVSATGYAETNGLDVDIPPSDFELGVFIPANTFEVSVGDTGEPDAQIGIIPPQLGVYWLIAVDGLYPPRP
ncbi:phage tail protein [Thalassospira lohafexi]|uniref:Phage tail collar domain-containing protein n=1 Tax=Thalassospira lohafexi TaxID=744227 RepID=A0A2N3LBJ4_9PROT|nr:tail fiber protein [Thalassospira lohafexi]PKR60138.1 hypothetical protein COO92_01875 [Thalassospira lohafexi]